MADNQAAAIVQAAKSASIPLGIEKGKLIVVGSNCLKQGIAGIKVGEQYSTGVQVPARTGTRAAEMIADHFNGKALPKSEILPVETITKANIAKWEEACSY
jgi:ABC-type sugar transport system substrate-binding protein